MLTNPILPHVPKAAAEVKYTNNFCQSVQKRWREGKREKRKKGYLHNTPMQKMASRG